MAALTTPKAETGWQASPFSLKGADGKIHTLDSVREPNGLLVMFICNHCPFVQAILDKIVRDTAELKTHGIGCIGIMANDTVNYPDDSFENMKKLAERQKFSFPYVIDETQQVARAYGAVCTPDFFGFNAGLELQYRGRLDATTPSDRPANAKRELFDAMVEVARSGRAPGGQIPSIGCSIKWK